MLLTLINNYKDDSMSLKKISKDLSPYNHSLACRRLKMKKDIINSIRDEVTKKHLARLSKFQKDEVELLKYFSDERFNAIDPTFKSYFEKKLTDQKNIIEQIVPCTTRERIRI